jgi:hypothetical protein
MPEAPRWAAVPRGDGRGSTVVRAAGPGLCLAWKLLWLATDARSDAGVVKSKDLYDAVVLAEHPHTQLTPRLLRRVLRRSGLPREEVAAWRTREAEAADLAWQPGDSTTWAARLATALDRLGLLD